jgi:hypothetical protein
MAVCLIMNKSAAQNVTLLQVSGIEWRSCWMRLISIRICPDLQGFLT